MKRVYQATLLTAAMMTATGTAASEWRVVYPDSHIGFVATYDDIPFDARFESFEADIRFAPGDMDSSAFDIRIDVGSVDSESVDRDEGMQQQEWLAAEAHPVARFRATRFEKLSAGHFKAVGTLELKGVRKSIEVPFEWREQSGDEATLRAETTLERGVFNIGTGEWAEDDTIGFEVKVEATLKLAKPP